MQTGVTVVCTNPEQILLKVTTEMNIRQWEELLEKVSGVGYYAPLSDLLLAVRRGIEAIRKREDVRFSDLPKVTA